MSHNFLVIQPVPHWLYDDQPAMWNVLDLTWVEKLRDENGTRVPGPLDIRELKLGQISASDLADYIFSDPDVAAVFRITGPAVPPGLPEA